MTDEWWRQGTTADVHLRKGEPARETGPIFIDRFGNVWELRDNGPHMMNLMSARDPLDVLLEEIKRRIRMQEEDECDAT